MHSHSTYIGIAFGAVIIFLLGMWTDQLMHRSPLAVTLEPVSVATTTLVEATSSPETGPAPKSTAAKKPASTPTTSPVPPLRDVISGMGNTTCSYERVSGNVRSSDTLYISNGKIRGEFRTTTSGVSKNTISYYDGSALYTWTEGTALGTKSSVRSAADIAMLIPANLTQGVVLGTALNNVSWDCHTWKVDATLLGTPKGVTFK
ncbi:MAG: hypothetical protein KBE09_04475 [Candidatus Pacebacteria bacterium]|nr:hypothetical protein [Candidatus Paceibacterota bacterium]